ncbi:hypothetical protein J1N35_023934 [Gossypium stocksii]|uniref:Legume lectin domain-containing protein n=1 Tax=Gossypium stocksii TaxID=47602 RepID=A0A9D4A3M7_9ROSI|nr:hypothetical protein J1N35_023934 [Gossypium stocksii]
MLRCIQSICQSQKPPLLSFKRDLSPYIYDSMYVGFSSSAGSILSSNYILAWSFKMNGSAEELDLSHLPKSPRYDNDNDNNRGIKQLKKILAFTLSFTGLTLELVWLRLRKNASASPRKSVRYRF